MLLRRKNNWPDALHVEIDGRRVSIPLRVNANAKHYRLTFGAKGPFMTVPRFGQPSAAQDFLNRQANWLAARINRQAPAPRLGDGAHIPVRGAPHLIVASGRLRGTVERVDEDEGPVLLVPGAPEHLPRRLTDWLKREAQADLEPAVARHAANLAVSPKSISVRGQTSRWGSCSSAGRLNFNWRLILAPAHVLDYVAAHEVAHMVEMNHSEAFWATVTRTLPDMEKGRAWLRAHGRELMRYGAQPMTGLGGEAD